MEAFYYGDTAGPYDNYLARWVNEARTEGTAHERSTLGSLASHQVGANRMGWRVRNSFRLDKRGLYPTRLIQCLRERGKWTWDHTAP